MAAETPVLLPRVDAVVLCWLEEPLLRRSVQALLASEKVDARVILVDNGCTTDDADYLATVPGVTLLRPGENLGFSGGVNLGAAAGSAEFVALINADLVVEPSTLARLIEELDQPGVAIAAGAVRLYDDPELLNSNGNAVHVLGLSWVGGLGQRETRTGPTDTAGAMGACLVTRRGHWQRLGGFYDKYFAYHEDAELSIRTWQMGLRVVNVPDATALHQYEFSRNPNKTYLSERNRLMFVTTLWSWRALLLLAPPLLALEVAMVALAAKQGFLTAKLRGWRWLWSNRRALRERRRLIRATLTVPDREWMRVLSDTVDSDLIPIPPAIRTPLNAAMRVYWRMVRRFV
jgi:GT2 family glycosyltransferase